MTQTLTSLDNRFPMFERQRKGKLAQFTAVETATPEGGSVTLNAEDGYNFSILLTGNTVLEDLEGFLAGDSGTIDVTQDGSGNHALTFGSGWLFAGGTSEIEVTQDANATDKISFQVQADGTIHALIAQDFKA